MFVSIFEKRAFVSDCEAAMFVSIFEKRAFVSDCMVAMFVSIFEKRAFVSDSPSASVFTFDCMLASCPFTSDFISRMSAFVATWSVATVAWAAALAVGSFTLASKKAS